MASALLVPASGGMSSLSSHSRSSLSSSLNDASCTLSSIASSSELVVSETSSSLTTTRLAAVQVPCDGRLVVFQRSASRGMCTRDAGGGGGGSDGACRIAVVSGRRGGGGGGAAFSSCASMRSPIGSAASFSSSGSPSSARSTDAALASARGGRRTGALRRMSIVSLVAEFVCAAALTSLRSLCLVAVEFSTADRRLYAL